MAYVELGTTNGRTCGMQRRKPGRPHKGDRKQVKVRLPVALAEAFLAEAARRGMTINDWIGEFAAEQTGVPYAPQEGLPLEV